MNWGCETLDTFFDDGPAGLRIVTMKIRFFWRREQWERVTTQLERWFQDPGFSKGKQVRMFNEFIGMFHDNINQLKPVGFGLLAMSGLRDATSLELC
jgi:hypothetical protein